MIKKLFLCAALVGAVGLTSCVDDVETASVQAIRGAKAEQYKANADFSNAQAEAAILKANAVKATKESAAAAAQAQADYKKAQAENLKAQAALKEAQTAAKNAKTESDKAAAAVEVERLKALLAQEQQILEKKKLEVEDATNKLQQTLAQYEAQIAASNVKAQEYKDKLEALVYEKADAEYDHLSTLVGNYTHAAQKLKTYQDNLYTYNANLAKYQAGLISKEDLANKLIAEKEEQINDLNAAIAANEAYIKTITTTEYSDAEKKLNTLKNEAKALKQNLEDLKAVKTTTSNQKTTASNKLYGSEYVQAINDIFNKSEFNQVPTDFVPLLKVYKYVYPQDTYVDPADYGFWSKLVETEKDGIRTFKNYALYKGQESTIKNLKATVTNGSAVDKNLVEYIETVSYSEYDVDNSYVVNENGLAAFSKVLNDNVSALENIVKNCNSTIDNSNTTIANLKTLKADYDKKGKAVQDLKAPAADATQEVKDKYAADKKAADDALTAATDALVKVIKSVDKDYTTVDYDRAVDDLKTIVSNVTVERNKIINTVLPAAQAYASMIDGAVSATKGGSAKELLENANKAELAYAQACLDVKVAEGEIELNKAEQNACNRVLQTAMLPDKATSIKDEISAINSQINIDKQSIKTLQGVIDGLKDDLTEDKILDAELLAKYNAQIATTEAQVAAQQELVDAAKALLDAALAEDAPAEN